MRDSLYEGSLPDLKAGIAESSECIAHIHMHFELLYVRSGIIPVMIAGTVYTLYPGDCAVILPGIVHHHMDAEQGNSMFLAVCAPYFAGQYEETLKENFAQTPVIQKSDLPTTPSFLLESLIQLLKGRQKFTHHQSQITLCTFQLFFAYTLPLLNLRKRDQINLLDIAPHIMDYISKNITKKLSLEIVSKELGISKYKISKFFANQLQLTFNQYVNLLRIKTAKKMLTTTNESITTICYESGFSAVRTFNTVFLQNTGFSPKEYRQKYLSGTDESKYDFYLDSALD